MVSSRDDYRGKAIDCVTQAEVIRDPHERAALLWIAQVYLKMAERISKRHERGTAHRLTGNLHLKN